MKSKSTKSTCKMFLIGVVAFVASACSETTPVEAIDLTPSDGELVLADLVAGAWERVCVAGPYSTGGRIEEITGSAEASRLDSQIFHSDGITLLVFLDGQSVTRALEVSNGLSDFTRLDGRCFAMEDASFTIPDDGWPHVQVRDD